MAIADKNAYVLDEYAAIVEEIIREDADSRFAWSEPARVDHEYPELDKVGLTLERADHIQRFEAVKENMVREVRSELSTVQQAYQYLENFEMRLLREAELEAAS